MLEQLRKQVAQRLADRDTKAKALRSLLDAPASENRDLNEEETRQFTEAKAEIAEIDTAIDELNTRVAELEEMDKRDKEREDLAASITPSVNPNPVVRVGNEPTTYRQDSENSFFMDAFAVRTGLGDVAGAGQRLAQHGAEVRAGAHGTSARVTRAGAATTDTGSFSSLVVPQYLPEMFAPNLKAGRVTADLATSHGLPSEGMNITIPRATNPTAVEAQSDQNTDVASESFDTENLVVEVNTYAGQQNVSRQALERGRGIDAVIYADLAGEYAVRLDSDVINGPGTNNRFLGIMGTSGVATTTVIETDGVSQIRRIAQAIGVVNGRRFVPADAIVVHPRRWAYWTASVDGANRPLVVPNANQPQNVFGVGQPALTEQAVGQVLGLPVYTDANIPTDVGTVTEDQDVILVVRRGDLHLWEDNTAPRQFTFQETLGGQLTVKLVIAGYSAFTAGHHPEGIAVVQGPGLTTPDFG